MKINFLFLLISLLLLVALVSCDPSDGEETTPAAGTTTGAQPATTTVHPDLQDMPEYWKKYHAYFDRDVTHKPTREDAMKVTEGMTPAEVIALIGKPHYESGSGLYYLEWYLADGDCFFARIAWPDDAPTPNPPDALAYLQYGVVGAVGIESP